MIRLHPIALRSRDDRSCEVSINDADGVINVTIHRRPSNLPNRRKLFVGVRSSPFNFLLAKRLSDPPEFITEHDRRS